MFAGKLKDLSIMRVVAMASTGPVVGSVVGVGTGLEQVPHEP